MKYIDLFTKDIWRVQTRNLSRSRSFLIRLIQISTLAIGEFRKNKCQFKASALTFYSLLSIVPIIAVMFGIAKGFGLEKHVEEQIMAKMQGQAEVAKKIMDFANSMLATTNGGIIAGVGVAFLFWTIIGVLSNIENSLNEIWCVEKSRTLSRKLGDYLSTILIFPILLVISGGMTVFVSSQIKSFIELIPVLHNLGPAFWLVLKLIPFVTVWTAFTFLFAFMPNTKVKFTSALIGGIAAGTAFQCGQWIYINFQIGAAKYGAIYGSFAALPLFLLWFQTSWLILLFGAEISFAHQSVRAYEFKDDCLSVSNSFKTLLSLLITEQLVQRFCRGEKPADAMQISNELDIPIRLVRQILLELAQSGVLSETNQGRGREMKYQPAIDVNKITVKFVIDRLGQRGSSNIPVIKSDTFNKLSNSLKKLDLIIEKSPDNLLLKDLSEDSNWTVDAQANPSAAIA